MVVCALIKRHFILLSHRYRRLWGLLPLSPNKAVWCECDLGRCVAGIRRSAGHYYTVPAARTLYTLTACRKDWTVDWTLARSRIRHLAEWWITDASSTVCRRWVTGWLAVVTESVTLLRVTMSDIVQKLKFHGSSFPRSVLVTSSRGCPQQIVRVVLVNDTDKRAALYTAADRRPANQVSAWQAGWGSRRCWIIRT